jgi:hypothetical protein
MRTTEGECLDALREAAEQLGKSPTKAEYEELGLRPSSTTITRLFGKWNRAKERAGLETTRPGEEGGTGVEPKPKDVELPDGSEWEDLSPQQRWYHKNREHRIEVKEARRNEIKQWFHELKRTELACARCGEENPPALDFHHSGEKEANVSSMVNDGYSKERIRREMNRCTVLCANCHRIQHYDGPDPATADSLGQLEKRAARAPQKEARCLRREWLVAYRRASDGCARCDVTSAICLEFHHDSEKRMRVGQMASFDHSISEIREEIEKCTLLCVNCHRDAHHDPPNASG